MNENQHVKSKSLKYVNKIEILHFSFAADINRVTAGDDAVFGARVFRLSSSNNKICLKKQTKKQRV